MTAFLNSRVLIKREQELHNIWLMRVDKPELHDIFSTLVSRSNENKSCIRVDENWQARVCIVIFLNFRAPIKWKQELKYPFFFRYQVEAVECILQYILKQSSNKKDQKKYRTTFVYACMQRLTGIMKNEKGKKKL